jgi:hypothetical protein
MKIATLIALHVGEVDTGEASTSDISPNYSEPVATTAGAANLSRAETRVVES